MSMIVHVRLCVNTQTHTCTDVHKHAGCGRCPGDETLTVGVLVRRPWW